MNIVLDGNSIIVGFVIGIFISIFIYMASKLVNLYGKLRKYERA